VAFARECTITGQLPAVNGLLNKLKLLSGKEWSIEGNMQDAQFSIHRVCGNPGFILGWQQ
jgi:hypothetical protein